jgi:hypothetical protein
VNRLKVGDEVKVICPSSQWRDVCGSVTEVVERTDSRNAQTLQECAVKFKTDRRWFRAEHLIKLRSPKVDRFVRGEIGSRWPVDSALIESINVSRESLIGFLCDHFGLSQSRATTEVDNLFTTLRQKLELARESESPVEHLKAS